jgi:hypothetical protein
MAKMSEVGVVHLIREQNGIEPFHAFLESYKRHDAGHEHDLVILFKGFKKHCCAPDEYEALLAGLQHQKLFVSDAGYDLGAYQAAAQNFNQKFFCFLNSYSVLLGEGWLAKMHRHLVREDVGLVGATGSYESHYANEVRRLSGMSPIKSRDYVRGFWLNYLRRRELAHWQASFNPFPNYHIRTNAFMIRRAHWLNLKFGKANTKPGCFKFESGKTSMTAQVLEMNLKALIIGRDGCAYEKNQWYESCTFRSGEQRNLLVADNRTEQFAKADAETKKLLAEMAWGKS